MRRILVPSHRERANAADPHHEPDDTVLGDNQVVLFDIGGQYRDYCSDMTRTFFWGEPDEESARIYDVVRRERESASAMVRPGVRFCDIDRCRARYPSRPVTGRTSLTACGPLHWHAGS